LDREEWRLPGLSIDPFNYCEGGQRIVTVKEISRRVDDLLLDTGLSIDEITRIAENIVPAEFDEASLPRWRADKLFQMNSSGHSHVQFENEPSGLRIRSTLPDGKHEYLYAHEDLPIKNLTVTKELQTYLDATPGLDIQYVFLFLNDKKQRISHVIHTANRNYTAAVPEGTAFVRFGWRVSGGGATVIKHLLWGHRKLEPAVLLGRSETLLLTNHYPQYDDLYRNGFVHTRVRAYQAHGVSVDVFRLRPKSTTSFHEFQNVDVTTGGQSALHKLLNSGRYRSVLVHFLAPEMWEVLEQYPSLRKIVWVHGSEIQPWHRREYNIQSEQERIKAMRESDRRMAFWRGILSPMAPNLKLVFVSRYFAEEVFEDLGFRLPDDGYTIIHNPIDTELFSYQEKPVEQRKRVLSIRPYASRTYANDLSVKAILRLSENPCFNDMEFRMIGDGKLFDETLEPLQKFSNVIIERRFLSHGEIAALHKEFGIFLVPSRMDTQGVSRDEAMASGLVPVTNAVAAIPEFVDDQCGILAGPEDADGLAAGLARLYEEPALYESLSRAAAARVRKQTDSEHVVGLEVGLFKAGSAVGSE
jgi:glycosyltransferase involved in cell wall biosynthesis